MTTTQIRAGGRTLETGPNPRRWQILGVLCVALFVIVMDNTIVNVALPTLARELGAGTSSLQWIVDAYTLVFAGLLLAAGGVGRPIRPEGARCSPGSAIFGAFSRRRLVRLDHRPADHRAGADGRRAPRSSSRRRWRSWSTSSPTPRERAAAIGIWTGDHGRRRGARPDLGWMAARALLVGLGLPGERPRGPGRHRGDAGLWSRPRAIRERPGSTCRGSGSRSPA